MNRLIGIDEAGRGPLAGPVSVGAVIVRADFNKKFFKGIKDSKKLSKEDRELWFSLAIESKKRDELDFAVSLVSENVIDKHGIAFAIRLGIKRCLQKIKATPDDQIFLDGALYAPEEFSHQLTVIRGDEKIPVISLASVCAKVTRDRYMVKISKKYPEYGFHINKGYGTLMHRTAIKKYGIADPHRTSFLRKLT
ncbi:MAG: ribonuclease HII [Patescibacteria group bacterium]